MSEDSAVDFVYDSASGWVAVTGITPRRKRHERQRPHISQKQRIHARDGFRCWWCGATENLSIDHIIPRSQGGSNDDANLQTLCMPCNHDKSDGPNIPTPTALKRRVQNLLMESRRGCNHRVRAVD